MFNDTIGEPQINSAQESADGEKTYYNMTNKGIAWQSDKDLIKQTKYKSGEVLPPPNWGWAVKDGNYTELHEIHENEEFLVWMRTAGLPSFSKLSRRQDTKPMPEGQYSLTITDSTCSLLFSLCDLLTSIRVQRDRIRRNKVNPDLYTNCTWWEKSVHGNCLCSGRGSVCAAWSSFYCCTLGASKV